MSMSPRDGGSSLISSRHCLKVSKYNCWYSRLTCHRSTVGQAHDSGREKERDRREEYLLFCTVQSKYIRGPITGVDRAGPVCRDEIQPCRVYMERASPGRASVLWGCPLVGSDSRAGSVNAIKWANPDTSGLVRAHVISP